MGPVYAYFRDGRESPDGATGECMSSSLLAKAAATIKRSNDRIKRTREANKEEEAMIISGAGQLAAGVGAAMIDTRLSTDGTQHKLFKVLPTTIAIGAALAVPALIFKSLPMRAGAAATGLTLVSIGSYRYLVDHHAAAQQQASQPAK